MPDNLDEISAGKKIRVREGGSEPGRRPEGGVRGEKVASPEEQQIEMFAELDGRRYKIATVETIELGLPQTDPEHTDEEEDIYDEEGPDSPTDAPWSPVPTALAMRYMRQNPGAAIDVVFPTVYEEDRTSKLKDLGTAEEMGWITHQRAAEQAAKEMGFEQYDYDDEMEAISQETPPTPTGANMPYPELFPTPDVTAQKLLGPLAGKAPTAPGGGGGGPVQSELVQPQKRNDLSAPKQAEFRKQQRQAE